MSSNINKLQLHQQNLQTIMLQKQQLEGQLAEIDSALQEISSDSKTYKILGKIMILSSSEDILKELNGKKETLELRLKNFSKQEEKIKENIDSLQKEALKELKENKLVKCLNEETRKGRLYELTELGKNALKKIK